MGIVFRIEDENGEGPFQQDNSSLCMNHSLPCISWDSRMRKIMDIYDLDRDELLTGKYFHRFQQLPENSDRILFGCSSLELLHDWVLSDKFQELSSLGFAVSVYETVSRWTLHGDFQSIFDLNSSRKLKTFPLEMLRVYEGNYEVLNEKLFSGSV